VLRALANISIPGWRSFKRGEIFEVPEHLRALGKNMITLRQAELYEPPRPAEEESSAEQAEPVAQLTNGEHNAGRWVPCFYCRRFWSEHSSGRVPVDPDSECRGLKTGWTRPPEND
jgi:hypothetical protein